MYLSILHLVLLLITLNNVYCIIELNEPNNFYRFEPGVVYSTYSRFETFMNVFLLKTTIDFNIVDSLGTTSRKFLRNKLSNNDLLHCEFKRRCDQDSCYNDCINIHNINCSDIIKQFSLSSYNCDGKYLFKKKVLLKSNMEFIDFVEQ